jgi:hypothetical protein
MYDPRAPADRQMLYINGAEGAFTARDKPANTILGHYWQTTRLLRKIDLGYRPESSTTADKMAWLIRQATKHPHYGPYIGSDCLSVVLYPDNPGMPTHLHPVKATSEEYGPHLVTPMLSTWDVEFNLDPKPLDLTDPEDDKKTFPGSPGNVASHRDTSGNFVVREGADSDSVRDTKAHYFAVYYREARNQLVGRSFSIETVPSHLMKLLTTCAGLEVGVEVRLARS